jgi:large subunit ribosomal protein L28
MANKCDICGKGPSFGNSVSHSHKKTLHRWDPNIQTVRKVIKGTPTKLNVCTKCIKAKKVEKVN